MIETILVTGDRGFIGRNLVGFCLLTQQNLKVIGIDNRSGHNSLREWKKQPPEQRYTSHQMDLSLDSSSNALEELVSASDLVIHLAGLGSVPRSFEEPGAFFKTNFIGTTNLAQICAQKGTPLVLASSSSVYGMSADKLGGVTEDIELLPISPYASSKRLAELAVEDFARFAGLRFLNLRFFNVFGPYQNPDSQYSAFIPKAIKASILGSPLVLFGGDQSRDWTFVGDLVELIWKGAVALHDLDVTNETINASFGTSRSLTYIIETIEELTGKPINVQISPRKSSDVMSCNNLSARLTSTFPGVKETAFSDALKSTIDFYRAELS